MLEKISLLQWNTLNKNYASEEAFPFVDPNWLSWEKRGKLIRHI